MYWIRKPNLFWNFFVLLDLQIFSSVTPTLCVKNTFRTIFDELFFFFTSSKRSYSVYLADLKLETTLLYFLRSTKIRKNKKGQHFLFLYTWMLNLDIQYAQFKGNCSIFQLKSLQCMTTRGYWWGIKSTNMQYTLCKVCIEWRWM